MQCSHFLVKPALFGAFLPVIAASRAISVAGILAFARQLLEQNFAVSRLYSGTTKSNLQNEHVRFGMTQVYQKQAVAIAMSTARKAAKAAGKPSKAPMKRG